MKKSLILLLGIIMLSGRSFAGWNVQNSELENATAAGKAANGNLLITIGNDIKLSSNNGTSWNTVGTNVGTTFTFFSNIGYLSGSGLYTTVNNGSSWSIKVLPQKDNYYSNITTLTLAAGLQEYLLLDSGSAGSYGNHSFYKSAAGSNTWQEITTFPKIKRIIGSKLINWCRSISFSNANTGWAVGDSLVKNDILFKTTDGGANWTRVSFQHYAVSQKLTRVYFFNQNNGWLIADTSNVSNIYKTIDGGNTWTLQHLPLLGLQVAKISFTDQNNGFCTTTNSNVFKTTDGGNNWTQCTFPGNQNFFFESAQKGYIASGNYLYKTTDGGLNWQSQMINTNPQLNFAGLNNTRFFDQNNGWASGDCAEDGINISRTTDGGTTWLNKSLPDNYKGWYVNTGTYLSSSIAYFVCDSTISNDFGNCKAAVFKTTDGGNSYTKLTLPIIESTGWSLYGIHFYDQNSGFAVGYADNSGRNGLLLKTTDGGLNWTTTIIPKVAGSNYWFFDISYPANNVAWAVSGGWDDLPGLIYKTSDNGQSWQNQNIPAITENKGFLSVCFINQNEGWAAGKLKNNGMNCIFRTSDGGNNWTTVEVNTGGHPVMSEVYKITFVNSYVGWLAGKSGNSGYIYKTVDGGLTWQKQKDMYSSYLWWSLGFVNENIGWAVSGDVILKTTDGGNVGITDHESKLSDTVLDQNYPNPFNNTTSIKFALPKSDYVTLTIYNLKGEVVKQLANGNFKAGYHTISFDAAKLSSGVYTYTLKTKEKFITNRMLLIK